MIIVFASAAGTDCRTFYRIALSSLFYSRQIWPWGLFRSWLSGSLQLLSVLAAHSKSAVSRLHLPRFPAMRHSYMFAELQTLFLTAFRSQCWCPVVALPGSPLAFRYVPEGIDCGTKGSRVLNWSFPHFSFWRPSKYCFHAFWTAFRWSICLGYFSFSSEIEPLRCFSNSGFIIFSVRAFPSRSGAGSWPSPKQRMLSRRLASSWGSSAVWQWGEVSSCIHLHFRIFRIGSSYLWAIFPHCSQCRLCYWVVLPSLFTLIKKAGGADG